MSAAATLVVAALEPVTTLDDILSTFKTMHAETLMISLKLLTDVFSKIELPSTTTIDELRDGFEIGFHSNRDAMSERVSRVEQLVTKHREFDADCFRREILAEVTTTLSAQPLPVHRTSRDAPRPLLHSLHEAVLRQMLSVLTLWLTGFSFEVGANSARKDLEESRGKNCESLVRLSSQRFPQTSRPCVTLGKNDSTHRRTDNFKSILPSMRLGMLDIKYQRL